jgi:glycosyltransferase involved in cell wall biosynthesis
VSIIIPCYNHAQYLSYAIRSVLAQTFNDWEAIIVDDGSTDETRSVSQQFLEDSRIHYIYQENQGLSAARNTGIRHAHGEYLSFLDADDALEPEFLQKCVELLNSETEYPAVYTQCCFVNTEGQVLPRSGWGTVEVRRFRERLIEGNFFPVHAVLVRKEDVQKAGLFDENLNSLEDWDLWLRLSKLGPFKGIPEQLVRYRIYPGSMSTDVDRMRENRFAILIKRFGYLDTKVDGESLKHRAYALAYRAAALGYIMQGKSNLAWSYLAKAVGIWSGLLKRTDTFYELACGNQPRGYRGQADRLDIEKNATEMIDGLEKLFHTAPAISSMRSVAFGNAYLSLAMLSDQAGHWSDARSYIYKALRSNPRLLVSYPVMRRVVKLCLGYKFVMTLRRVFNFKEESSLPESKES